MRLKNCTVLFSSSGECFTFARDYRARRRLEKMSDQQKPWVIEKILAYSSISIIVIAVVSYITTLIVAMAVGREVLAEGLWQVVTFIAYVGLPLGFALLITLLIINFSRRGREK